MFRTRRTFKLKAFFVIFKELKLDQIIWNTILTKSRHFILNVPNILWEAEILLWIVQIYYERSRFSWRHIIVFSKNKFILKTRQSIVLSDGLLLGTSVEGYYTEKRHPEWMGRTKAFFLIGWSTECVTGS